MNKKTICKTRGSLETFQIEAEYLMRYLMQASSILPNRLFRQVQYVPQIQKCFENHKRLLPLPSLSKVQNIAASSHLSHVFHYLPARLGLFRSRISDAKPKLRVSRLASMTPQLTGFRTCFFSNESWWASTRLPDNVCSPTMEVFIYVLLVS